MRRRAQVQEGRRDEDSAPERQVLTTFQDLREVDIQVHDLGGHRPAVVGELVEHEEGEGSQEVGTQARLPLRSSQSVPSQMQKAVMTPIGLWVHPIGISSSSRRAMARASQ